MVEIELGARQAHGFKRGRVVDEIRLLGLNKG